MNKAVNLVKRVHTPNGPRFCAVLFSSNGRVRPNYVIVKGKEEKHTEGSYYLSWYQGGKRCYESVGNDAAQAAAKWLDKTNRRKAIANGVKVADEDSQKGRRTLRAAIDDYLEEIRITKKKKTYSAYSTALEYFAESCRKDYLDELERKDMLQFIAYLRDEKELEARTVRNKFGDVMAFLKHTGIKGIINKNDWPKFTQTVPEIYEHDELTKLFSACDAEERVWYEFFLMTGCREQEVMYMHWSDVNLFAGTVRVKHKPEYGWTPKQYKEREVPIPQKLVKRLKAYKKAHANGACPLLFPTSGCRPNLHFLEFLKAVAKRAGLNPDDCWLHKFRSTFATRALWSGIDLRTVQSWLGHSDLESTMRYLRPAQSAAVREKVEAIFA